MSARKSVCSLTMCLGCVICVLCNSYCSVIFCFCLLCSLLIIVNFFKCMLHVLDMCCSKTGCGGIYIFDVPYSFFKQGEEISTSLAYAKFCAAVLCDFENPKNIHTIRCYVIWKLFEFVGSSETQLSSQNEEGIFVSTVVY